MKKSALIIMITAAILAVSLIVLAILNGQNIEVRRERQENAVFAINAGGQTYTVNYEMLESAGIQTFTANKKTSGKPAIEVEYQGVPLKKLCESLGFGLDHISGCITQAADGYHSAVSIEKINDSENVFIAAGQDGKPLKKKSDGGDGPFMLVIAKDQFSQNWCKYLSEITFQ